MPSFLENNLGVPQSDLLTTQVCSHCGGRSGYDSVSKAGEKILPKSFRFIVFGAAIFLGCFRAAGQTTAALNGAVTDPTGATVQGVRVSITNVDTGIRRELHQ